MTKTVEELAEKQERINRFGYDPLEVADMAIAWIQAKGFVRNPEREADFIEGVLAGYQAAQPKWISVETPPEKVGYYLVLLENPPYGSKCHQVVSYFEPTPDPWWDQDGVLRWMPLPTNNPQTD